MAERIGRAVTFRVAVSSRCRDLDEKGTRR
jgi:hypothetical protein